MGVEFRDLTVSYDGSNVVLEGINWTVRKGDFWSVIGPNGAGKSTLFKALLKRTYIHGGDILIDGNSILNMKMHEIAKRAGVLLQTEIYERSMKVKDYVMLGRFPHLGFYSKPGKVDENIVFDALQKTGSLDLRNRLIGELSSGEFQRVRIARILAQESEYIFLDEPTAHLDYAHRFEVMELLKNIGKTVVCILHDFDLAYRYAEKIMVLHSGRKVEEGVTQIIFRDDLFQNVFRVRITRTDTHINIDPLLEG